LLSRGLIDRAEWQTLIRAAALDALVALAIQLAVDRAAVRLSFTDERAPCASCAVPMDAGSAWAYAEREAGRLTGHAVVPDARPRLAGRGGDQLAAGWSAMPVPGQMDGQATVRELAWRNGLALYGVMDWVARLIQHGACTITSPRSSATAPSQDSPLPGRRPGGGTGPGPLRADIQWTPPHPSLLARVLAGLRQLP
jgi:hypothetical protein